VYATSHGLVTPEAVVLDLPTASPGTRVLARLLDVLITLVVFYALVVLVGTAGILGGTVSFIVSAFGLVAAILAYPVLMEGLWGGRTPGKAALGLRVVRTDGAPIGLVQAALRGALGLVEVWGTLGSLGFIVMLFSSRDQRLGDMAAGALVLRERQGRALRPVELLVPPGCEQLVMTLDVGAMSADDYELVRSFLVRWRDFAGPQRVAVAATVAGPLWQRFRHPIPAGLGPDYYLACLGAAYQYRHQSGEAAPAQPQWGSPYDAPPRDYGEPSGWPAPR
jgi:uncharacterized RDD family membrane protein YckC